MYHKGVNKCVFSASAVITRNLYLITILISVYLPGIFRIQYFILNFRDVSLNYSFAEFLNENFI